jgi:succinate dehydrogenase / fumarate reductase cytochrome b subunit
MATAATAPPDLGRSTKGVQPLRAGEGHSFLWRRLHSLSGIIPIGAFLVEHIVSNFETFNGPVAYAKQVVFLNSLPLVRVLEWGLIFIPLLFHALYGVFIAFRGRVNVNVYPWASNWMYLSQRVTGLIAFAYILQHVIRQRFMGVQLPECPGMAFAKVQHELSNPWMLAIYVIAMIATTWHFGYGIWLFAAKWGITPGDKARKRFGYVCTGIGTVLCVMGLMSIYAVVSSAPVTTDVLTSDPASCSVSASAGAQAPPNTVEISEVR